MSDDKNALQKQGGGITPTSPQSIEAAAQQSRWKSKEREELHNSCEKMYSPDAKAVEGVNFFLDKKRNVVNTSSDE